MRRPASRASARRRAASAPPPSVWCPASPLVTATNRTRCPSAAYLAAMPPARWSQSSGWAPNAMMLSLPSALGACVRSSAGSCPLPTAPAVALPYTCSANQARTVNAVRLFIGVGLYHRHPFSGSHWSRPRYRSREVGWLASSRFGRLSSRPAMITRIGLCLGLIGLCAIASASHDPQSVSAQADDRPRLSVKPVADFEITGAGDHAAWRQTEWTALRPRQSDGHPYESRFKVLYSNTGLYFLMEGTDRTLTVTMNEDFMDLWNEDVFEVFLWTDQRHPLYFEYEISPFNHELPIIVPTSANRR